MSESANVSGVKIPLLRPRLPDLRSISSYIERIDQAQIYSNHGPLVRELEFKYANNLGVDPRNVVAVTNATLGITLAVQNHSPDHWRVPDFTFSATALAVLNTGKKLELVDVDEQSWGLPLPVGRENLNVGHLVVMPFGNNASFERWKNIPNVVFDAAASLGDPHWKLEKLSCVLVLRNKSWFKNNIQSLENVWKIIEKERITGYEHRAPNRKNKIKNEYIDTKNGICLIKLDK
jgi:hypothetical protein